ncbi:ATP-binding protein [Rheinheimera sp. F8]|uniref:sensor histidine kinase n=1 Tax=Rheinheimera sp. F8 TaxID=1763998 RepID=UPI000744CBC9|nr:ATP-binding protein [Rheinheimera sp. F8]ALZ75774.1 hypothetical protein ATY27_08345 [Rheinheimera sp. F8]
MPRPALLLCYLLLLLLTAAACQHWIYQDLRAQAVSQSHNLAAFLRHSIGRHANLPAQLGQSPLLQQWLAQQDIPALNHYLAELQQSAGVADLYLVSTAGIVLASSNSAEAASYVGRDFGFRPYVLAALQRQPGFYYALGHTSGMRGVYYSAPMLQDAANPASPVLAVLVAKVDLEPLELQQQQIAGLAGSHFIVTGQSNEIFLSDVPAWRLTKLDNQPLSATEQQRYLTKNITALQHSQRRAILTPWQQLWRMPLAGDQRNFLAQSQDLTEFGWQLTVLTPATDAYQQLSTALLLTTLLFVILLLGWRLQRERQKRAAQLEQHARQLEQRVIARTADLAASNQQLVAQIRQREQTETALAQTEQELVQAAKLATIGSLSASLNHELNQPLTALSSYSQTTAKMLDKAMYSEARQNLQAMQQLIARLSNIVAQFKDFSRKSAGKNQPVDINKLVLDAVGLVHHQCQRQGVKVRLQLPEVPPQVLGDPIQLEQVLVNLLTNALQAMQQQTDAALAVAVKTQETQVQILLKDQGPGIEPHHLERIFEAFFTTKQRDGLGLGLSISQRIIQSFAGKLEVRNHPQGGAEFCVTLPLLPMETC